VELRGIADVRGDEGGGGGVAGLPPQPPTTSGWLAGPKGRGTDGQGGVAITGG
jgi:hypothetical protein